MKHSTNATSYLRRNLSEDGRILWFTFNYLFRNLFIISSIDCYIVMYHTFYEPHPALQEYISGIFVLDIDFTLPGSLSPIYTFVPSHTRFICFYLHDQVKVRKQNGEFIARERAIIIGPQLTPVTLDLGKKHQTVIVVLKPCSMYRLLGVPLEEIVDRDFDARLILGREIDEVLERLMEAGTDQDKNEVVQNYFLCKLSGLKPALPFDRAMLQQVNAMGSLSMDYLASQSCLSVRQFERKSLERIGLPPKLFARMVRFTNAYKFKEDFPHITWNEIAYRFGYFDQMHFIRDFKYFAGFIPHLLKKEDLATSVRFQTLAN